LRKSDKPGQLYLESMKFKGVYFFSSPVARTELLVLSAAPLALPSYVRALLIGVFFSQDA